MERTNDTHGSTINAERNLEMENNPCVRCKYNNTPEGVMVCDECVYDRSRKDRFRPMTNGDKIRAMTDEELAQLLTTGTFICEGLKDICEYMPGCEVCMLAWLRSPVEESHE